MGKLHELLAVEPDLKAQATRTLNQVKGIFEQGTGQLLGLVRSYEPLIEEGEQLPPEETPLATTARDELQRLREDFAQFIDAAMQKELTNQYANADLAVNEHQFYGSLPATALLNLEAKFIELRRLIIAIPVNDSTERWEWNEDLGCWQSQPKRTFRTKKIMRSHVLYEATPEHPAQVEAYTEDAPVGTWTVIKYSGMISPKEKRQILGRCDAVARAVKQARQRANNQEIEDIHIGQVLLDYIFDGK